MAEGKTRINNEELLAKLNHLLEEALHYKNSQVIPLSPSPGRWHQEAVSKSADGSSSPEREALCTQLGQEMAVLSHREPLTWTPLAAGKVSSGESPFFLLPG